MYFILFFNITTKIHYFLWNENKNNDTFFFQLTKCYRSAVKIYLSKNQLFHWIIIKNSA